MLKSSLISFGLALTAVSSYASQNGWLQSLSVSQIHSMCQTTDGQSWIGTDIGVVRLKDDSLKLFNSLNGLQSNDISSLICEKNDVFAISKQGHLARYNGVQFVTFHTAFSNLNWKLVDHQVQKSGQYLLLPFEKGLAFFNLKKGVSDLTLENIGAVRFDVNNLRSLAVKDGRLYVSVDSVILTSNVNFEDVYKSKDSSGFTINLAEPKAWQSYSSIRGNKPYRQIWFEGDSIGASTSLGMWVDSTHFALPEKGLRLGGELIPLSIFDTASNEKPFLFSRIPGSLDSWVATTRAKLYRCDPKGTCVNRKISDLGSMMAYDLFMDSQGNPFLRGNGYSGEMFWQFNRTTASWTQKVNQELLPYQLEYLRHNLANTMVDAKGRIIFGTWGFGFWTIDSVHSANKIYNVRTSGNTCIETAVDGTMYDVIPSVAVQKFNNYAVFQDKNQGYGVMRIDSSDKVTCYNRMNLGLPQSIQIWSDTLVVSSDQGIDLYSLADTLQPKSLKTFSSPGGPVIQFAKDRSGAFWFLTNSQLSMTCNKRAPEALCRGLTEDTAVSMMSFLNLGQVRFTSMAIDAGGTLWIGTKDNGVIGIHNSSQLSLSDKVQYQVKDGLGSNSIVQIKASPFGEMWFSHTNGLSRLTTTVTQPEVRVISAIRPYPNPFRYGSHDKLKISNLPDGSSVHLLHPSGQVLMHIDKEKILGGVAILDLKDQLPDLAPGTYKLFIDLPGQTMQKTLAIVR